MRLIPPLPLSDIGEPDVRSAVAFMRWMMKAQWLSIVAAGLCGTTWLGCIAALPAAMGKGIDDGIAVGDTSALLLWAAAIVVLAVAMAVAGAFRHRMSTFNYLTCAYRTVQLTTRHSTRVGASLPQHIATGEVVSVGSTDPETMGKMVDVLGRTIGSIVTFVAVAVVLLNTSVTLGTVILIGLPLQALMIGPLLKPLQHREHEYREQQGILTSRANDIVAGLRVLRGIGGEDLFHRRYAEQSAQVRRFGIRVAAASAVMKGLQTLLPGGLLVAVTWLGARLAVSETITIGQLVAAYGYTSFLLLPMGTFLETARKFTTAHAASRRIVRLLSVTPNVADTGTLTPLQLGHIHDPQSRLHIEPGEFTALVCTDPTQATAIADRLGRYVDSDVTADSVPIEQIDLATLRGLVTVADNEARFFAGSLRGQLDPHGRHDDSALESALDTAVATDARDSLGGLDGHVDSDARNVSGGQRQRLRLARALLHDPQVLILVEPTSAVDAHTEALIAERLPKARNDRTTIVTTSSPLVLEHTSTVCFVHEGEVVATGTHRQLMDSQARYRAVVEREAVDNTMETVR